MGNVTVKSTDLLVVTRNRISVVSTAGKQGLPGVRGDPGPPGGATIDYVAGTDIGGHRVVILDQDGKLAYASADNLAHMGRVIGVTIEAASMGDICHVQKFDKLAEVSWSWNVDMPVYLGANGLLTQQEPQAPSLKFSMVVGFPVSSTSLYVNLREPIILSD